MKVLVVDDSALVRREIQHALGTRHQVVEAFDGLEGLKALGEDPSLGLVLLDVNMPRMTGLEMLEKAKALGYDTPILMLTTEVDPALIRRAKQNGARGWLIKPVAHDSLLQLVDEFEARAKGAA